MKNFGTGLGNGIALYGASNEKSGTTKGHAIEKSHSLFL